MNDILSANIVEITIDKTGKLWVNVDGKCQLRIGQVHDVRYEVPADGRLYASRHNTKGLLYLRSEGL